MSTKKFKILTKRLSDFALKEKSKMTAKKSKSSEAKETKSSADAVGNHYDIQPDFPAQVSPDAFKVVTDLIRGGEGSPDKHCVVLSFWHVQGFVAGQMFTHQDGVTGSNSVGFMSSEELAKCLDDCIIDDDKRPDGYKAFDWNKAFQALQLLLPIILNLFKKTE